MGCTVGCTAGCAMGCTMGCVGSVHLPRGTPPVGDSKTHTHSFLILVCVPRWPSELISISSLSVLCSQNVYPEHLLTQPSPMPFCLDCPVSTVRLNLVTNETNQSLFRLLGGQDYCFSCTSRKRKHGIRILLPLRRIPRFRPPPPLSTTKPEHGQQSSPW